MEYDASPAQDRLPKFLFNIIGAGVTIYPSILEMNDARKYLWISNETCRT
jgi:hypothetical protein